MKRLIYLLLFISFGATAQTVGIKVAAPIIKNSPSDNTVTGYADLLNGGYHITPTISGRDSLNTSYSKTLKTGMLCYVTGVDSTYRWNGSTWIVQGAGNVTLSQLTDSLSNYTPLQDGLISGGNATIGTGSVTIDTAYYRIDKINYMSIDTTFTGISNSASGTQYYILVYGKDDNTLDTLQGVQDTIATIPTRPDGTVSINTVLVGDGGVESSVPDLSGYAKLNGGNTFMGKQIFSATDLIEQKSNNVRSLHRFFSLGNYLGDFGFFNDGRFNISANLNYPPNSALSSKRILDIYTDDNRAKFYGTVEGSNPVNSQDFVTKSYGDANYLTGSPDTTVYRTVANSYTLASGQPRLVSGTNIKTINSTSLLGSGDIALEVPLTFGYGTTRTSNTITSDTTSGTGLVSKTRLTGSLASKQGLDATLTALASYNTNGILTQTGADTFTGRTLTGTTNQVIITNGSGVSGNPTFSLPQDINTTATPQFARIGVGSASSSSSSLLLPAGTTSISSLRLPNGVAPTSPVAGDIWGLTSGVRLQRFDGTNTKDFIFSSANYLFTGTGSRLVETNATGDLLATKPILSILVTDSDVISAITGATYTSDRATITPSGSKVFYTGQLYDDSTYTYIAIADNVVRRF